VLQTKRLQQVYADVPQSADNFIGNIMPVCDDCGEVRHKIEFTFLKKNGAGICNECKSTRKKKKQEYDKRKYREGNLRKYGLTIEQYDEMVELQENMCAICGGQQHYGWGLFVDHDHVTEKVRGLLCSYCNSLLGFAKDNPVVLMAAVDYLDKTSQP
jgi:hypothetical protein